MFQNSPLGDGGFMLIKRKKFIQVGSLATASLMLPKFLKAFEGKTMVPPGNKVVVILQLSGGNDGLNTVGKQVLVLATNNAILLIGIL